MSFPVLQRGFTLVELMVALMVLAILAVFALPGFNSLIGSTRSQSQINDFVDALNYARAEAVRRSGTVRINPVDADEGWSSGWSVWWDENDNGSVDAGDEELRIHPALIGASLDPTANVGVGFNRQGSALSAVTFEYRLGDDECFRDRDVTVTAMGRVSVQRRNCS